MVSKPRRFRPRDSVTPSDAAFQWHFWGDFAIVAGTSVAYAIKTGSARAFLELGDILCRPIEPGFAGAISYVAQPLRRW
jgi:hypothetical protein